MAAYFLTEQTAADLHALINAARDIGRIDADARTSAGGERVERPDGEAVWRVFFSASVNDGAGAFVIYLGAHPLTIDGADVTPTGITPATAPLDGAGYYTIDDYTGGELWLNLNTTAKTAAISGTRGSTGAVLIAKTEVDAETGAVEIEQNLIGALVLASGGGSYVSVYEPQFTDGVLSSVGSGLWPFGRQFYTAAALDDSAKVASGFIVLEITHGYGVYPTAVIKLGGAVVGDIANTDTNKTILPLYEIFNGAISLDCRPLLALAIRE